MGMNLLVYIYLFSLRFRFIENMGIKVDNRKYLEQNNILIYMFKLKYILVPIIWDLLFILVNIFSDV